MSRYLSYLRSVLLFVGLAMLVPAAYAYFLGESLWMLFVLTAALMLAPGLRGAAGSFALFAERLWRVLIRKERQLAWNLSPERERSAPALLQSDAIVVAALAWVLIPLIAAIPYLFGGYYSVENAVFESMSGWTATGLSFAQGLADLPRSLLFFRSFTQWIGGVGIVLFALLVLRAPAASQLLRAESRDAVAFSVVKTAKIIWGIYLLLTLAGVLLLHWTGMDWFSSVNLSMVALATGGFIPSDSLVITGVQKLVFVLLMVWGGTAFSLHLAAFKRDVSKFMENTEYKIMLTAIALFSLLIVAATHETIENALFHVTSALSGTGLSLEALGGLGDFGLFLLFLLMISGACSGSTTGALKLWRTFALLKSLVARTRQVFLPQHAIQVIKVNKKILKSEDVVESGTFVFLYLFVITVAAGILMALGLPALDSLFLSASALGNVGLSVGATWYSFPLIGKAVLFVCMWLGRIEILPSLVLLRALRHSGE